MKRWYKSKTIAFNAVTLIVTLSGVALQYVGDIGLTPQQMAIAGMSLTAINTLGNLYLRTITHEAIV